jgi:hypothetical protein
MWRTGIQSDFLPTWCLLKLIISQNLPLKLKKKSNKIMDIIWKRIWQCYYKREATPDRLGVSLQPHVHTTDTNYIYGTVHLHTNTKVVITWILEPIIPNDRLGWRHVATRKQNSLSSGLVLGLFNGGFSIKHVKRYNAEWRMTSNNYR